MCWQEHDPCFGKRTIYLRSMARTIDRRQLVDVDKGASRWAPEMTQGCLLGAGAGATGFAGERGVDLLEPSWWRPVPFAAVRPAVTAGWHARASRGAICRLSWATGTPSTDSIGAGPRRACGMLQALADGGGDADALQMIDSTIVRAHHCAAGAKGGLTARVLNGRAMAFRPRSICAPTLMACIPSSTRPFCARSRSRSQTPSLDKRINVWAAFHQGPSSPGTARHFAPF